MPSLVAARAKLQNAHVSGNHNAAESESAAFFESAKFVADFLNEVNIEIQKQQRLQGQSFVSRTTLESVYPGVEVTVLRAVMMNPFTTSEILAEILAEQEALGRRIVADKWKRQRQMAPADFSTFFGTLPDVPC